MDHALITWTLADSKTDSKWCSTTQEEIHSAPRTAINGLQTWNSKALAGRGVLIDYASYAKRQGISVDHFTPHGITLESVKAIAEEEGIEFRSGDVLFLRTGYAAAYQTLDREGRTRVSGVREWCGLAQSRQTTEWLWERQFAAVASDSPGFEVRRKFFGTSFSRIMEVTAQITNLLNSSDGEGMAPSPHSPRWVGNAYRGVV